VLVSLPGRNDNPPMAVASAEERQRFVRLAHRERDLVSFFDAADRALAASVPFDASCWLTLDPATLLPTSHFTREFGFEHLMLLASNEYVENDVNKFASLARATPPVGILSLVTGGDLNRSVRYSTVLAPNGYAEGDELRATFLDGDAAWGCVAIHRRHGMFDEREAGVVADLGRSIGDGIRRAILAHAIAPDTGPSGPDASASVPDASASVPGLVILRGDDSIESMTPAATRWIGELVDATGGASPVPLVLVSLASVARKAGAGQTEEMARARLPTQSGGLLLAYASVLDGPDDRVAVMLDPSRAPALPALVVEAYGLTRQERAVTRCVLQGLSTHEIADDLHLSTYTVQDHLKSVFEKVGVRSRRELVAQLFTRHYAPRLATRAPIGSDGWFTG
jgi:DNA-binding CsgD family transcriptional regulator